MRTSTGFTLVEVMVTVAVAAIVLVGAHRIQSGVLDAVRSTGEARQRLTAGANGRRLLAKLAGGIELSPEDASFVGYEHQVTFTTWSVVGRAWPERMRVTFLREGGTLLLTGLDAPVAITDSVEEIDLDYLPDAGASARWMRVWTSSLSAPVAIRLRIRRGGSADTLLLYVGSRG